MNITRRNTALLSITALFIALGPIANSGAIPYCVGVLLSECVELPNGLQYDISACKKAALLEDNYDFLTFIPIQTCTRLVRKSINKTLITSVNQSAGHVARELCATHGVIGEKRVQAVAADLLHVHLRQNRQRVSRVDSPTVDLVPKQER